MNSPLYTVEILRLAASLPESTQLERIDAIAEERSPACGSSIHPEVQIGADGRIVCLNQEVHACAFGQASAALVAANAQGRSYQDVASAFEELSAWLSGGRPDPGHWPGLTALEPALPRVARHGAILLPFKALMAALDSCRR